MSGLPRGLRSRTATASGLIVLTVFTVGAFWMASEVRSGQDAATRTLAEQQADTLIALAYQGVSFDGDYGSLPYELVAGDGDLLASSAVLRPYEVTGRPVMPAPGFGGSTPLHASYHHAFASDPRGGALAGRRVLAVDSTQSVVDGVSLPDPSRGGLFAVGTRVRAYVFVTTTASDRAVADLVPFLAGGVPVVVVAVVTVGVLAVRRSLRPVEAIRARTADVTATDPRERVPVPRTGDEIEALALTINDTLTRIEDGTTRQRTFVSDAAHELRGPVAALAIELEIARAHPDRVDWSASAPRMERSVDRLSHLVNDLLTLARPGDGASGPKQPVRIDRLVDEAVDDVRGIAESRRLTVTCDLADCEVTAHQRVLARAVRNLLANAVRHASTRVEVLVRADEADVVIEIADDGRGVPPADRERVFERFVRLDEGRSRDEGGVGLGLAIAREAVEIYDGSMRIVTGELPGATFQIRLQRARRS